MTGLELLLAAMVMVESGGDVNAVGDGGASVGPLQISQGYFTDAMEQLRREGKTPNYRYPRAETARPGATDDAGMRPFKGRA